MPAEGGTTMGAIDANGAATMPEPGPREAAGPEAVADPATFNRRKVYVEGSPPEVRVPFVEVSLAPSPGAPETPNEPVLLYDTSGPGSDPEIGLPPLRLPWITGRADVVEHDGRTATLRDDGRAAVRRGESPDAFPGSRRPPL